MIIVFSSKTSLTTQASELTYKDYDAPYSKIGLFTNGSYDINTDQVLKGFHENLVKAASKSSGKTVATGNFGNVTDMIRYVVDTQELSAWSGSDYFYTYQFQDGPPYSAVSYYSYSGGNTNLQVDLHSQSVSGNMSMLIFSNSSTYDYYDPSMALVLSQAYNQILTSAHLEGKLKYGHRLVSDTDTYFAMQMTASFCFLIGILNLFSYFIGEIVNEKATPIGAFFYANGLTPFRYWMGNFLIDLAIYEIFVLIIFLINFASGVGFIKNFPGITYLILFSNGPGLVFFTYCVSFLFRSRVISTTIYLLLSVILVLISYMVIMFGKEFGSSPVNGWLNGLSPPTALFVGLYNISSPDYKKTKESTLISSSANSGYIFGGFISWGVWLLVLWGLETFSRRGKKDETKYMWKAHEEEFAEFKHNFNITEEALEMERQVENNVQTDWAVRILRACKVFQKSTGKPFAAVNSVSLGIPRGSLFGFLGANGAGKSTMINMIQNQLMLSGGTIEVDGISVGQTGTGVNPRLLGVCPQFDDHLTMQFTPYQQLKFFAILQGIPEVERDARIGELIEKLGLTPHATKLISQLSGGNQRKVSIAAAFLAQAHTILLDEPTTSLDPVARHLVHDLIRETKRDTGKTFMLTTHMLDEAESLCDNISIMLHGCVYAVGTPQYLAAKFGTSWNVDMILEDSTASTANRLDEWMGRELPDAHLALSREFSRIYTIPSTNVKLTSLFRKLIDGQNARVGVKYFTCSSSTLEKVFLEIVELSDKRNLNGKEEEEEDDEPHNKGCCGCRP